MSEVPLVTSDFIGIKVSTTSGTVHIPYDLVEETAKAMLSAAAGYRGFRKCSPVAIRELRKIAALLGIEPRV